jgi:preprotein translocase subunit SecE
MATAPITFFHEVRDELKKVVWPTRQEVIRLTLVVIAVSLLVGMFLGGLDFLFTKTLQTVVK